MSPEKLRRIPLEEHIPYQSLYATASIDPSLTHALFRSAKPLQTRGETASILDLRRTSKTASNQTLLDTVSTHLGINFKSADVRVIDKENNKEYEKAYAGINLALSEARRYMEEVLEIEVPHAEVHSKKDIIDLLRKTALYGDSNRQHLERHAAYCALLSVALAVFELQREEAHLLENEMKEVEKILLEPATEKPPLLYSPAAGDIENGMDAVILGVDVEKAIKVRISMRDKSRNSQITKYLRKPEATAAEALKDAIGLRVEVEKPNIENVAIHVLKYFREALAAADLKVENANILLKKQEKNLSERITNEVRRGASIKFVSDVSPLSDDFKVLKITGKIAIPNAEDEKRYRSFELQIVTPDNKNESGLGSHAVYEFKKRITVMTRLFGGCSKRWLEKNALAMTGNREQARNVIEGLQNPKIGFLIKLPGTEKKYAAADVYERWLKVDGLITESPLRRSLEHKVGLLK